MKHLRKTAIILILVGLIGAAYYWAYKTSSMGWVSSTKRPVLRVMGMNLDYTERNGRRFSKFFGPLIEKEYRDSAARSVEGIYTGIGSNTGGMMLKRAGTSGMSFQFGPEHAAALENLARDSRVTVWYKQKAIPEQPFCYHYYLTDLVVMK